MMTICQMTPASLYFVKLINWADSEIWGLFFIVSYFRKKGTTFFINVKKKSTQQTNNRKAPSIAYSLVIISLLKKHGDTIRYKGKKIHPKKNAYGVNNKKYICCRAFVPFFERPLLFEV